MTRILAICLLTAFAVSCSSPKKKTDEDAAAAGGQDTTISAKDMTFDPGGSDTGNIAGLTTVYFGFDRATLTEDARNALQQNADWLKQNAGVSLLIEGHCDRMGSIEYNLALGERRAKAVKAYLANLGIEEGRLSTISYGKERPLDPAENAAADSKNRRANFLPQK